MHKKVKLSIIALMGILMAAQFGYIVFLNSQIDDLKVQVKSLSGQVYENNSRIDDIEWQICNMESSLR